jgi:hypothetical protein
MVRTGPLTVDLVSRVVTLDGRYIALTRQEYRLVHLLASHLGSVIIHNEVMEEIWGNPCPNNVQYVRTLMRQLRRKLEVDPSQPKLLIWSPVSAIAWSATSPLIVDRTSTRTNVRTTCQARAAHRRRPRGYPRYLGTPRNRDDTRTCRGETGEGHPQFARPQPGIYDDMTVDQSARSLRPAGSVGFQTCARKH